jgi:predicted XRE-type DNA-binding protein
MPIKQTPPLTAELAAKIKTLVNEYGLLQHQAAAVLGLNQGRVSEVINGHRYNGVMPCPPDQLSFDL